MKRIIILFALLFAGPALAQQTPVALLPLPPNTVIGNPQGITANASAIPFAQLYAVFSITCPAHQFVNVITASGGATCTQPAFTDISGAATAAQLPTPTASTIGGVQSFAAVTNQWINAISTAGVPSAAQPAFSNISGQASLTSQVTGTLPFANGGTNDSGTAATSFSGTINPQCGTATFTVQSARTKLIAAKITWFQVQFTITVIGTCAGNLITFTLPSTAQSLAAWGGQEIGTTGFGVQCKVTASSAAAACTKFDGSVIWVVNNAIAVAGTYENQ